MTTLINTTSTTVADIFAKSLPYIQQSQGKTIVIKYGGNAMTEESLQHSFAQNIVLLKLIGINPIIVHGGGPQIDRALKTIGKPSHFIEGMRITDKETMKIIQWVLVGEVQQSIVMLINKYGGHAIGLTGKDGELIRAQKIQMPDGKKPGHFLDIGLVGEIRAINLAIIKSLQEKSFIPIISPIGFCDSGETYNINADIVAGKIAGMLHAEKLIMMTNIGGVQDEQGHILPKLSTKDINRMCQNGTISNGMLPKIHAALDAAYSGVNTVNIIDGRIKHALILEILTNHSSGTTIYSSKFET